LHISASVGVASAQGEQVEPVAALAARADEALYAAKRGGRNRVVSAAPSVGARAEATVAPPAALSELPSLAPFEEEEVEDTVVTRVSALPGA
jgi:predicted signal transduction protein with EAL and GGDEF domain